MKRLASIAGVAAFATLLVAGPQPAQAECPYVVIPPVTDGVRSAREVIVGTVIEDVGGQLYDFRLRIDHVLRGRAHVGDVRRFSFLYPGWPPDRNGDGTINLTDKGTPFMPCQPIPGAKGNVIALALGALAPDGKTRYNAASWISGRLPVNQDLPRTTLAEVQRLAAMPDTAAPTVTIPSIPRSPGNDPQPLVLGGAIGLGAIIGWLRGTCSGRSAAVRARPAR